MDEYRKIETENPLLDEIIYNCKIIMSSLILKDEGSANRNETVESAANFDIYNAIVTNRIRLYYFDVSLQDFVYSLPYATTKEINEYILDTSKMSYEDYHKVLQYKVDKFLETYEEKNEYYRLISGLPPLNDKGIYLTEKDIEGIPLEIDISKPIHKMTEVEKTTISATGLLDKLKERYPDKKYLKYYDKKIDAYTARLTPKYDILYMDDNCEPVIYAKFKELFNINREYIITVMDYDLYKYYSPLYERFIMMNITINTVGDMISSFSDFYINREVFDMRTAKYFMEAYGVEFYPEIPLRFQKRIVRNLNRLIKYKGTDKVILDIAQIFGFDKIELYKYYLYKYHKHSTDPSLSKEVTIDGVTYTIPGYSDSLDPVSKYDLYFVRVPFQEMVNSYLKDNTALFDYDSITLQDEYWDADEDHTKVKKEILDLDFNTMKSKYIAVNTMYSISEASFEVSYFVNMLMYYGVKIDNMTLTVPGIDSKNSKFNLFEIFVYIYALTYLYLDFDLDAVTIETDQEKLLNIHGFNLFEDLTVLSSEIYTVMKNLIKTEVQWTEMPDGGYITINNTIEQVEADIKNGSYKEKSYGVYSENYIAIVLNVLKKYEFFQKDKMPTIRQLVNTFVNNKEVYDFITYNMIHAEDLEIYRVYRKLYDTLMIIDVNNETFKINKNGEITTAKTYIEYLQYASPRIYLALAKILKLKGTDKYKSQIYDTITNTCNAVQNYINSDDLMNIFMDLPTDTADLVKQYMVKVIKFFMSFKITMLDMQSIFTMDYEPNRILDGFTIINALYYFKEYAWFTDSTAINSYFTLQPDLNRAEDDIIVNAYYESKNDNIEED